MASCPLCTCAAAAGGHWPSLPAWMCIAWGAPLSSPFVCSVTVATLPLRRISAFPAPVTWLVGTAPSLAGHASPTGLIEVLLFEDPEPKTTTATTPATTRRPAASGQRYLLDRLEAPAGGGGGGGAEACWGC